MTQEAGQEQPIEVPDLTTPKQDFVTECQAHTVGVKPGPKTRQEEPITIDTVGKVIGRDKKPVPTQDVFKLAAIGCKDHEIADWFGVDQNTLRYNFSVELLKGRETLKQSLRRKQIEVAMSGNAVMLIWLGKNMLGQSDSPLQAQDSQVLPWEDE